MNESQQGTSAAGDPEEVSVESVVGDGPGPGDTMGPGSDSSDSLSEKNPGTGAKIPWQPPRQESIGRSTLLMSSGTLVSRVMGLVRQSMLAAVVGTTLVGDAFGVANTLPNYVFQLLSAGVLNAVLIPQITRAMRRDDGGSDFIDRLLTAALLLVVLATVVATVATPALISATSDFSGAAYHLAVLFGYLCLPQIAFYGLYAVLGQVLNARGQFASFMWSPVLANLIQIAGLVWFLVVWGRQGDPQLWTSEMVWVLAGSSTLGIVIQGIFLAIPLARGGFRFTPRWGLRGHGLGSASRMVGWTLLALVIAQLGGLFVMRVMTMARNGAIDKTDVLSVAARDYAFLIFILPHSLITVSILTALFPRMSRAVHDQDGDEMRALLRRGLSMPAVFIIPSSLALMVMGTPVVTVLLPGLALREARVVGQVLALMAIGTMAFGITTLQQRYCFAREDGRTNLGLQSLLTCVQIGFGVLALVVPARWAVHTVGAGQSVANIVAAAAFLWVASRQMGGIGLRHVWRLYVRLGLASLVAAGGAYAIIRFFWRIDAGYVSGLAILAASGLAFLALFYGAARALHIQEVDRFVDPVLRRLGMVG